MLTDVELIDIRYSGPSAKALRGIKAVYFSCIIHTIIKVQVMVAMAKILEVTLGWDRVTSIAVSSAVPIVYSVLSGLWGVVITDFLQFLIAMVGAVVLAVAAVDRAGGMEAVKAAVAPETLRFFPPLEFGTTAFMAFLGYVGLSWWSRYSSDGGGVVVQRIASCRSEREGYIATYFFNIANYALRTWPWVIAALASLVLYPSVADNDTVYVTMVLDLLPSGMRGLVMASFLAAFMSTLSTYLNLSSAYFVNDFYMPFIRPGRTERHYVGVSRGVTLVLAVSTAVAAYYAESIESVFKFLIAFGSGTGLVYILRWFWWRINAWSEISAIVASTITAIVVFTKYISEPFYVRLGIIILVSTVIWVFVTFITRPTDMDRLVSFVRLVRPGGRGWERVRQAAGNPEEVRGESLSGAFWDWTLGSVLIVGLTMGTGKVLLGFIVPGLSWLAVSAAAGFFLRSRLKMLRN